MTVPRLRILKSGRVLNVVFDNPPRHFFDEAMSVELDLLTRALARDSQVGAVVFTGSNDTFITHLDVPELLRGVRAAPFPVNYQTARIAVAASRFATRSVAIDRALRHTRARDAVFMARVYRSLDRLNQMDKVTIASINGLALGMGCILALACDLRYMSEDVQIGLPETALGMLAGAGGTQRLTRMLGSSRALELLLEGRWMNAAEAHDLGVVHRILAARDLQAHAQESAERLARRSPVINREIKRAVYDAGSRPLHRALRREAASLIATVTSPQTERRLAEYDEYLGAHAGLSDAVITAGWIPLLDEGPHLPTPASTKDET